VDNSRLVSNDGRALPEWPVDTDEAAGLLEVPMSIIWSWHTRGRVTPVAYRRGRGRRGGAALWRLEELQPLAEKYHQRVATRRAAGH
jgi:hypothetical protein